MGSRRFSASTKEHYGLYYYGLELIEGLIHVEEKKKKSSVKPIFLRMSENYFRYFVWNQVKEKQGIYCLNF